MIEIASVWSYFVITPVRLILSDCFFFYLQRNRGMSTLGECLRKMNDDLHADSARVLNLKLRQVIFATDDRQE